jgi:hypothetical protein
MGFLTMQYLGFLEKMKAKNPANVQYFWKTKTSEWELNPLVGQKIKLTFLGRIQCQHCGKMTKKSWQQGYCYPCTLKLAECDICIVRPELCHFAKGTCRDEAWAKSHCFTPHVVYLANSSGLKVGITRETQIPTRWIDQGATQALPLLKVKNRFHSGLIEKELKAFVADKTQWQKLVTQEATEINLISEADKLKTKLKDLLSQSPELTSLGEEIGSEWIESEVIRLKYPIHAYPQKAKSHNFEKELTLESTLVGIKGQYLLFEDRVLNIRNHTSYEMSLEY